MARSSTAEVQEEQTKRKKPGEVITSETLKKFNDALAAAITMGKTFSLSELEKLAQEGEKHRMQQMTPMPASREEKPQVAVAVPVKKMEMTPIAVTAALSLAEQIEGASTRTPPLGPMMFSLRKWVNEGRT